ncbi:putative ribonuclease T2 [Nemania sp. FL0916]|nr:putative ribonuclease T2 [Nemania sp. FL0916]
MASFALSAALLSALPLASASGFPPFVILNQTCTPMDSCSIPVNNTGVDACCVNTPGGLFLQPQFWDTDPVTGPDDSWTIHGLWPDNCDGTYQENCDKHRRYKDIGEILEKNGKSDLVQYMRKFWQSNDGSPEAFWEHEWATHGTCVSTIDPKCYPGSSYKKGQEAADYFQVAVDLFKNLDTYGMLSKAGIMPSSDKTYTSQEILGALEKVTGKPAVINCKNAELYQVYYGFYVNGPLARAKFVLFIPTVGQKSDCPSDGIKYVPKC